MRLLKPFFTKGGVKVPHKKNLAHEATITMPEPDELIFPLQQHIGAVCKPFVKVGSAVKVGDVIANSDNLFSSPIHSSVSGNVSKIAKITMPDGNKVDAIYINSDKKRELSEKVKPHIVSTKEELVDAARQSGLVGLGGAGFPTHIKLNVPPDKKVETLLINAAECEPYITSDNRAMLEDTSDIIDGILLITKILKIQKAVIAIEDNKPDAILALQKASENHNNISIMKLKSRYPQGAEKILIKVALNKVVSVGKLPIDIGVIVLNISSVAFLSRYIKTGMPLIEKRITVDGSAVNEPHNLKILIGTPIEKVINFCKGYKSEVGKILMGGPMMGIALADDKLPILKQNNAILAFSKEDSKYIKPSPCIRCGKCIQACPMGLMPTLLESNVNFENTNELKKLSIMNCMECGSCAFSCPASRPLVQSIRLGKKLLKEQIKKGDN